jgi:DNA-binding NarL/FixJ family response regulator
MTEGKKTRIIIVDDHPIFRQGLTELINRQQDLRVCGEAEDSPEAMRAIRKQKPDMVVTDISLKTTNGLELIKDIRVQYPNIPIVAISMHEESYYAERALRAGAKGYITKQQAPKEVVVAIREILSGRPYVSSEMTTKMLANLIDDKRECETSPIDCLSDREMEVFRLIGKGLGVSQIADKLALSVKTIETFRLHIREKLDLADASELRQYAIQWSQDNN